jgi:hypothetical protein
VRGSGGKRSGEGREGWGGIEAGRELEGKEEKYEYLSINPNPS